MKHKKTFKIKKNWKSNFCNFPGIYNTEFNYIFEYIEIDNKFKFNFFPYARKIVASTIGLNLVSVKPMSSPNVNLTFLDFKYDKNTPYIIENNIIICRKRNIKYIYGKYMRYFKKLSNLL